MRGILKCNQNIAGLLSKRKLLELTISELTDCDAEPDVLCFSETFLQKGDEKNVSISNYKLAAYYSRSSRRGGTCILMRKGMVYHEIKIPDNYVLPGTFECCGVSIPKYKLIILCVYTSHNKFAHSFFTRLEAVTHDLLTKIPNYKIIIAGDFNINTLVDSKASQHLIDMTKYFNLKIHIN